MHLSNYQSNHCESIGASCLSGDLTYWYGVCLLVRSCRIEIIVVVVVVVRLSGVLNESRRVEFLLLQL